MHGNSTLFTLVSYKFTELCSCNWKNIHLIGQQLISLVYSKKGDESSWSKNDSWGAKFSLKMPAYKNTMHPYITAGFVDLFSFYTCICIVSLPSIPGATAEMSSWWLKKEEKLSPGRWHRNPKIWNEINGQNFSLLTCQILAKEISCSLKRALPEFLSNQIKIQTLSWRPYDFIAAHVHLK